MNRFRRAPGAQGHSAGCSLLVILLSVPMGRAQDPIESPGAAPGPLSVPQRADGDVPAPLLDSPVRRSISLEDYVREVLGRNLDLRVAQVDAARNVQFVQSAQGNFDPELFARVVGGESETPTASQFTATGSQTLDASAGLRGLMRSGATYDFTFTHDYTKQRPTNPFFDFNPTFSSAVSLNVTQPLLRGAGTTVTESEVQKSELRVARGDFDLMDRVQQTANAAVLAYWNLVFEMRSYHTAEDAHSVALELVDNNIKKRDAGIMTILDVAQAESEEKRRMEELIRAETRLLDAEDAMKALLSPGDRAEDWEGSLLPSTAPGPLDRPLPEEVAAIETSLRERPDLKALAVDLQLTDLDLILAEDGMNPALDLLGSYGLAGLDGRVSDASSGTRDNRGNSEFFFDSLDPIFSSQFERWSVGLDFSYPLGNRTARATREAARLAKDRAWMIWSSKRNTVVQETRNALRAVKSARARILAASEARRLAEEQLRAEEVRFGLGSSTTFDVRESQRDLFEAQDTETRAILDYEIELARLAVVQGKLAEAYGVQWEGVETMRPAGAIRD